MNNNIKKWCVIPKPNPTAEIRIFCFPYAGGNSSIFHPWANKIPEHVELVAIQPPGRGSHYGDAYISDMNQMTASLLNVIPHLMDKPYVFFGHSLGSRVAFDLLIKLKALNLRQPEHFFASGSKGPHLSNEKNPIHSLPKQEFIHEIEKLNGTPKQIIENPELMEFLIPMLRADFEIAYTYQYEGSQSFDCDCSVLGGEHDKDVSVEDLESWFKFFDKNNTLRTFNDGHFFIETQQDEVVAYVSSVLSCMKGDVASNGLTCA